MTDQYVGRLARGLAIVAGLAGAGAAWADAVAVKPIEAQIRTGRGKQSETFIVETLSAPTSPAVRINEDRRTKAGQIPDPTPGYTITSTVIVRGEAHAMAGLDAKAVEGLPGYWTVKAGSVGEAMQLADNLARRPGIAEAYVNTAQPEPVRLPADPQFSQQWNLRNLECPGIDVNAVAAWNMGYTGSGVLIGIIEGPWQTDHPDLKANYNAGASMTGGAPTSHATSVAGIIAGDNNSIGGVGIAYNARLSQIVKGTSLENAEALLWKNSSHKIKNNSWGPSDNGTLGQVTQLELDALAAAATAGRSGLGTIVVWAGGNGAAVSDRVDYDPFASSRYVVCVAALDDDDDHSYYSEPGSSILVSAHSSGGPGPGDRQIFSTTSGGGFTATFGGTSAAAPVVSGVIALMLQANPALTWRDVQHVLVNSARLCDPMPSRWTLNGAGRYISYEYGFGAVDAEAAVTRAITWHPVPPEMSASVTKQNINVTIPDYTPTGYTINLPINRNFVVESAELKLNATTTYVGDLRITLRSPAGTESILSWNRFDGTDNLVDRVFTTKRPWGERAGGTWRATIADMGLFDVTVLHNATLTVYGYCPADVNRDSSCDVIDLLDFLEAYPACEGARAPCYGIGPVDTDYNRDGAVDIMDLLDFVDDLDNGC